MSDKVSITIKASLAQYAKDIHSVHVQLVKRYRDLLGPGHLKDMCETYLSEGERMPVDKQGRWVGYIQRGVIKLKLTTVDKERFITRPMFHAIYKRYGLSTETVEVR